LNGHTIFVIDGNVSVNGTVNGTGAIVAAYLNDPTKGNVSYTPNSQTGDPTHGVLIVVLGNASFWPGGTYYGWVAAKVGIDAKLGNSPSYNWLTPNYDLDFPNFQGIGGSGSAAGQTNIITWDISNQ
jgi:hypothetical protein